jgi:hypothetical protein
MCPELQPILSQCENKKEGTCDCKLFCKQQMELMKNFILHKQKFKLRDGQKISKDSSMKITYEQTIKNELEVNDQDALRDTVIRDID